MSLHVGRSGNIAILLGAFLPIFIQTKASVLMQRLSYPTETVLSNKITRNRIVLSFKDSPRKPLRRRPAVGRRRSVRKRDEEALQKIPASRSIP